MASWKRARDWFLPIRLGGKPVIVTRREYWINP
jgi:hypothetical protein